MARLWACVTLLFVAVSCTSSGAAGATATVGEFFCGSTISLDSYASVSPAFSLPSARRRLIGLPGEGTNAAVPARFTRMAVDDGLRHIVESESRSSLRSVTLFSLRGASTADAEACAVFWDPASAAFSSTVFAGCRIVPLSVASDAAGECNASSSIGVTFSVANNRDKTVQLQHHDINSRAGPLRSVTAVSFSAAGLQWPVRITVSPHCVVTLLLLANRYGSLHEWYVWIPVTVYTAVVALVVVSGTLIWRRRHHHNTTSLALALVFMGFLGCMVGLVVEITLWNPSMGALFPFPDAVTLYCCLVALYIIFFVPFIVRSGEPWLVLQAVLRLLVYGTNCALCIGYWLSGYVVFGSLTLLQYVATNAFLTLMYVRFVAALAIALPEVEIAAEALSFLWFAPATPLAPCVLLYYDLFLASHTASPTFESVKPTLRDVALLYGLHTYLPVLVVQNMTGLALLIASTVYHVAFLVLLFVVVLLFLMQALVDAYSYHNARQKWRRSGWLGKRGALPTLWPDLGALLQAAVGPAAISGWATETGHLSKPLSAVVGRSASPPISVPRPQHLTTGNHPGKLHPQNFYEYPASAAHDARETYRADTATASRSF